jgi:sugar phosphate isomerase/epimerase
VKIGFYTATFGDRPTEEVLDFAVQAGFDAIELDVGSHVLSPEKVGPVVTAARDRGLFVSSLALFGSQLDPSRDERQKRRATTLDYAVAAAEAGVPTFVLFAGRDPAVSVEDNYRDFADHAQALLAATDGYGTSFAIENWPGPDDRYIATTPSGWDQLFRLVPDCRLGLEFDPSHLIRLGIDPFEALKVVRDRVKILHGKDTSIDPARLQAVGYHGEGWWRYRLPGTGLLDWTRFLGLARNMGLADIISIEHEDSDFGWQGGDLEARERGERQALDFLRRAAAAS